jgi:hypothetical protein
MAAYLVRTIHEHDIVGFFAADEIDALLMTVDECTDPAGCEYLELPAGGLMWTGPAISVPLNPGKDDLGTDGQELPWAKVQLTDLWWSAVYGYSDDEWTEFFPDAPRTPRTKAPAWPMGPGRVVPLKKQR